jgi:hypothetical protein
MSDNMALRLKEIHRLLGQFCSSAHSHDLIELALATATSLAVSVQDHAPLVWLLVSANPSSGKTETILTLKGVPSVFYLDTLTENSFLSGYVEDAPTALTRDQPKVLCYPALRTNVPFSWQYRHKLFVAALYSWQAIQSLGPNNRCHRYLNIRASHTRECIQSMSHKQWAHA